MSKLLINTLELFDEKYNLVGESSTMNPPHFDGAGKFETYGEDRNFITVNYYMSQQWSFNGEQIVPGLKEDAIYFLATEEKIDYDDRHKEIYYMVRDDLKDYLLTNDFRNGFESELNCWFTTQLHGENIDNVIFNIMHSDQLAEIEKAENAINRKLNDSECEALKREFALITIENIVFNNGVAIGYKDTTGKRRNIFCESMMEGDYYLK